mmetsp:Transcript_22607/g.56722  ORF Transcript_22607/g.56722 Transcript_22607/m.56722 type:complete len:211 (+) Transcript_22607:140-772(+)
MVCVGGWVCVRVFTQPHGMGFSSMLERSGPTPTHRTGQPTSSSMRLTYLRASSGSASHDVTLLMSHIQPSWSSYSTSHSPRMSRSAGKEASVPRSLCLYATPMRMTGMAESTSSLVMLRAVNAFSMCVYRTDTISSQPQRRGRPVVTPNSPPVARSCSPTPPRSSVGNGPDPTRVEYAFTTPRRCVSFSGDRPQPVHTPPTEGLEDVTKG